jgi:hypothetical protein
MGYEGLKSLAVDLRPPVRLRGRNRSRAFDVYVPVVCCESCFVFKASAQADAWRNARSEGLKSLVSFSHPIAPRVSFSDRPYSMILTTPTDGPVYCSHSSGG